MFGLGDICMIAADRRDRPNSTLLVCPECRGNTHPECGWCYGTGTLSEAEVDAWREWSGDSDEWEDEDLCSGRYSRADRDMWLAWRVPDTRLRVITRRVCDDVWETDVERMVDRGDWWVSMTGDLGFRTHTSESALRRHCTLWAEACERWVVRAA